MLRENQLFSSCGGVDQAVKGRQNQGGGHTKNLLPGVSNQRKKSLADNRSLPSRS
jgi:hypothetical protein